MKCQLISKMLGVVLIVSPITALAESNKPNFDSATEILTVPIVSVDEEIYLLAIGAKKPIKASIGSNGDVDWYSFDVVAGRTYVLELFDVANNFALVGGRNCSSGGYKGIFPIIYDPAGNETARQCRPNGTGDIHNFTTFTAGIDGDYFIRVAPHAHSVFGSYSIRVLKQ